jgi:hypothetical protein
MLAGGGEACTDIEVLATQDRLFTDVCSDTTLYRTFTGTLDAYAVGRARDAVAGIRSDVWGRIPGLSHGDIPVILDIDASLVEIHSENKDGAAPNFKGGYGFHPVFCFSDATGEALAGELRPGNAAANDTLDLLGIVDRGVAQLPAHIRIGHTNSDEASLVEHPVVVRSDSAGGTKAFAKGCRVRNIGFQVVTAAPLLYQQLSRSPIRTLTGGRGHSTLTVNSTRPSRRAG